MTTPQILSFAIIGGAIVCFAWGRFRYDMVSLVALLVGLLVGVVPAKQAFSGFTSDVVVIIASRAGGQRGDRALRRDRSG